MRLKTIKALGISFPLMPLGPSDRVIERRPKKVPLDQDCSSRCAKTNFSRLLRCTPVLRLVVITQITEFVSGIRRGNPARAMLNAFAASRPCCAELVFRASDWSSRRISPLYGPPSCVVDREAISVLDNGPALSVQVGGSHAVRASLLLPNDGRPLARCRSTHGRREAASVSLAGFRKSDLTHGGRTARAPRDLLRAVRGGRFQQC